MPKREYLFYLSVAVATLLNELAIQSGIYVFVSLPLALGVVVVGLWAFRKEKPSG